MTLGASKSDTLIYAIGKEIARQCKRIGIHINFAPLVDVNSNPLNPVISSRAFGEDKRLVARLATQYMKGMQDNGVLACAKHFPGHGNALADSHLGVADVTKTWQPNELLPYKMLIESGQVDAVMTAHIVNGQLDASLLPATLSKKIMTGILREKLGFRGVIFSDDMQMKAISEQYSLEESIFKAMEAGVDVLMFSNNIPGVKAYEPENIHSIIRKLVETGKITEQQIDASFRRVMALKMKQFGS